jgi:hypothetical protein
MTTRQNEVRRILFNLNGHQPDDALVSKMANIAESVGIKPDDALFPAMIAFDHYLIAYQAIPEMIKEASSFMLREHAEAFRAEAEMITEEQKRHIRETTKKTLGAFSLWLENSLPGIMSGELEKAAATAVYEPVKTAAERFEKATAIADKEITKLGNAGEALRKAGQSNKTAWTVVVFAAALLGGAIGGISLEWAKNHWITPNLTSEQQNTMTWGKVVEKSWNNLPPQAQKILMDTNNGK